ncbi:hypothetical protein AMK59_4958, partial [Oryctes borbonicus]
PKPDISLEDAYGTLNIVDSTDNQKDALEDVELDYVCYHRTGIITSICDDGITIDNIYSYKEKHVNLAVGTKVSYICYTKGRDIKITNVSIVDNEWNCEDSDKKFNWCYRTIVGKVIKRERRNIFIDPGDIIVNLNEVNSEFVPIVGDWLELDVISEIDENVTDLAGNILQIHKINPLRHKVIEGVVRTWDLSIQNGTINFNIFFDRESLCAGYIPSLKDKVVVEAIESEQRKCSWRALKVLSAANGKVQQLIKAAKSEYDNHNIDISDDVYIEFTKINNIAQFKFEITNTGANDIFLNEIIIQKVSIECKILSSLPIHISPNQTADINGECVIKTAGYANELITFSFNTCNVTRRIEIFLKTLNKSSDEHTYNNKQKLISNARNMRNFIQDNNVLIRAPKPFVPARFVPYRLPEYPVPKKLWDACLSFDNAFARDELMVLKDVLSFQNYEKRFHILLHLEEINSIIEIRKFDRDQICFIRNGEYLMLEYESLSEQRPSIIAGDAIIAKDIFNNTNECYEGFVYKVGLKHVYLKFNQNFHDKYNGEDYSVSVTQSRTQFRRMHQAVGLAVKNLGRKFLFPTQLILTEPQLNLIYSNYENGFNKQPTQTKRLSYSELKKIMHGNNEKPVGHQNKENMSINPEKNVLETNHSNNGDVQGDLSFKLEWFDKSLNYYQKEAVRHVLLGEARPLPYFIFGPPGTGKTVTLVEIILQILRIASSRILVAAPSNSAANLICLRLIKSGVLKPGDLVRLVSHKCITDNMIPPILAPYCATTNIGVNGTGSNANVITESGLTLGINSKTIGKHRVTVSTCTSLGALYSMSFSKGHFSHIIIDEAGQATEPEIMIPLSFLDISSSQCVLAGDPMQLGPVVCSKYASEFGLNESFMERLLNRFPYIRDVKSFPETQGYDPKLVTKLLYNYRSLPGVLELPNSMFYFSELKPTISAEDSELSQMLIRFKEFLPKKNAQIPPSFVFHGVNGENYQLRDSPSWYNPHEISQVFYYVNEFYRTGCTAEDIGIITPYSKQTKEIRAVLSEAEFDVPKVGTVEEFQGQEFKIIILSTVRSNKNMLPCDSLHNLGFVTQPKRLNVALTRAQTLTIVVGNPHLLINDSSWRYIIQFAVKNGCYCGCDITLS